MVETSCSLPEITLEIFKIDKVNDFISAGKKFVDITI